jgi:hypothetical protein
VLQCFRSSNANACFVIRLVVIASPIASATTIAATFTENGRVSMLILLEPEYISVYAYMVRQLYAPAYNYI